MRGSWGIAKGMRRSLIARLGPGALCRLACLGLTATTGGCASQVRGDAAVPAAALYPGNADFSGQWTGYIGSNHGELRLERLREGVLGGNFIGDDPSIQFALVAKQDYLASSPQVAARAANRLRFEWQDGSGSSGRGWLLVSREGRALTGEFGFGETAIGGALWNFTRGEAERSD